MMLLLAILGLWTGAVVSIFSGLPLVALALLSVALVLPFCDEQIDLRRPPDVVIGVNYLSRWHVIPRNPLFNVYLHKFLGSDDERALHDHPWVNCSIVLKGSYREHTKQGSPLRRRGSIVLRRATAAHRLEVVHGPVWTLFITGPRIRAWGFHCPQGWVHWRRFTKPGDKGQIGQGCNG